MGLIIEFIEMLLKIEDWKMFREISENLMRVHRFWEDYGRVVEVLVYIEVGQN